MEKSAESNIAERFAKAAESDLQTTQAIFARMNEMSVAYTVLIAELRKQDVSKAVLEALAVLQSGVDEMVEILRRLDV